MTEYRFKSNRNIPRAILNGFQLLLGSAIVLITLPVLLASNNDQYFLSISILILLDILFLALAFSGLRGMVFNISGYEQVSIDENTISIARRDLFIANSSIKMDEIEFIEYISGDFKSPWRGGEPVNPLSLGFPKFKITLRSKKRVKFGYYLSPNERKNLVGEFEGQGIKALEIKFLKEKW